MSKVFFVPTPIGNLEDITLRALEVLKSADVILAEDTRHSKKLLQHYGIQKPLIAYHMHNEHRKTDEIIEKIKNENIHAAVITDAGTPGISDPGFLLARSCIKKNVEIECLPGPSSFIPALVSSGLPCDRFVFEGFLPPKKGRKTRLKKISENPYTSVIFESPYKLKKTLTELQEVCNPDRPIAVAKELTKIHEKFYRGEVGNIIEQIPESEIKGEFIIILGGNEE
jgi:16S rRNA (cytidine1402-2'-O)-methyltransferase